MRLGRVIWILTVVIFCHLDKEYLNLECFCLIKLLHCVIFHPCQIMFISCQFIEIGDLKGETKGIRRKIRRQGNFFGLSIRAQGDFFFGVGARLGGREIALAPVSFWRHGKRWRILFMHVLRGIWRHGKSLARFSFWRRSNRLMQFVLLRKSKSLVQSGGTGMHAAHKKSVGMCDSIKPNLIIN